MKYYSLLTCIFLAFFCTSLFAQDSVPLFSSKKDSVDYAQIMRAISDLFKSMQPAASNAGLRNNERLDSLFKLQAGFKDRIIGYKTIYKTSRGFTDFQDLKEGKIDPADVQLLSINDTGLTALPTEVFSCANLKELELINTSLKSIPSQLSTLKSLESIYVYNNTAGRLKLEKNAVIRKLVIHGSYSKNLPRNYKHFANLDSLDLSKNIGLTKFPRVAGNKTLYRLNLSGNQLTLKSLHRGSRSLSELNLFKNNIRQLPSGIKRFPNLRKLNVNLNKVTDVHASISSLKNLESLSLYQNELTSIPKGIYYLTALKELDLYYNKIAQVDTEIGMLQNLSVLYLSHNELTSLPESLGKLQNLKELYAHDNKIGTLPESIGNLRQLRVLRVNNNYLSSLPTSLLSLNELENLDVAINYIHKLPINLESLSKLQLLSIVDNPWENKDEVNRLVKLLRERGAICIASSN